MTSTGILFLVLHIFSLASASRRRGVKHFNLSLTPIPEDQAVDFAPVKPIAPVAYRYDAHSSWEDSSSSGSSDEDEYQGEYPNLLDAVRSGSVKQVNAALDGPTCNMDDVAEALAEAAYYGHLNVLKVILADPRADPSLSTSPFTHASCLQAAIEADHLPIVQALLDDGRIDLSSHDFYNVRVAWRLGREAILECMLAHPKTNLEGAIESLNRASANK